MSNQSDSCGQRCPLGQLSDVLSDSLRHYQLNRIKDGGDADRGLQELTIRSIEGREPKRIEVAGLVWTFVEQRSVGWQFAPDDPRYTKLDVSGGRTLDHFGGQMTGWLAVVDGGQTF